MSQTEIHQAIGDALPSCVCSGLTHVPINCARAEGELHYIVEQSAACALFHNLAIAKHIEYLGPQLPCEWIGTLHGGNTLDILAFSHAAGCESAHRPFQGAQAGVLCRIDAAHCFRQAAQARVAPALQYPGTA
ncbi:MAG: hypothetical protein HHJ09_11205 [Glaciimonas sp.]|nr:hypothetical protein [Glaciimonas sp.]